MKSVEKSTLYTNVMKNIQNTNSIEQKIKKNSHSKGIEPNIRSLMQNTMLE